MITDTLSAESIRRARLDNPKMRERDLAQMLGISEAQFLDAWTGQGVERVKPDFAAIFPDMAQTGEVMVLTRNESAVHEKIGCFEKFYPGKHAAMTLGENIDLRLFPKHWKYGFAVEKLVDGETRKSLQFFDEHGDAVQKLHIRPGTNMDAWEELASRLAYGDEAPPPLAIKPRPALERERPGGKDIERIQREWLAMTDTHQFVVMLKKFDVDRLSALEIAPQGYAWQLEPSAVEQMMEASAEAELPIMCFVGNRGAVQIHSGPIKKVRRMGYWLNVLDPTFHLHLRTDHIDQVWAVRKPTEKGHVTSLEAFDAEGNLLIQFFGKRIEGQDERPQWRSIVENLEGTKPPSKDAA